MVSLIADAGTFWRDIRPRRSIFYRPYHIYKSDDQRVLASALARETAEGEIEKVYPLDDTAQAFGHSMKSQGEILFENRN